MTERTARRPRRPAQDEETTTRSARRGRAREDDDQQYDDPKVEDERPARRGSSRPTNRRAAPNTDREPEDGGSEEEEGSRGRDNGIKGGWGTWRQRKSETASFADDFKVDYKEKYLILILDSSPFAAFNEHWVDEVPKGTKRSWPCIGKGCPLCELLGEKPRAQAMFNVVEFVADGDGGREGILKVWTMGSGVANILEEIADDTGLEGNYFKVTKTKNGSGNSGNTTYHIIPVKERDLPEDWDFKGVTDDEYEEFVTKKFDSSYIRMPSKVKLREIADMVLENG